MAVPEVVVDIADLTAGAGTLTGTGVFDILMIAGREHLQREYDEGRITGTDFAQVYIATMQSAMQQATMFTLTKDKVGYEIDNLIQQNALTAEQLALITAQTAGVLATNLNIPKQGIILDKQAILTESQIAGVDATNLNIPKQGQVIDAQKAQITAETLNIPKQGLLLDGQVALTTAQTAGVNATNLNIPKQGDLLDEQVLTQVAQTANVGASTALTEEQRIVLGKTQGFQPMR